MTEKKPIDDQLATREKFMPASKPECIRQIIVEAHQTDATCAKGISPALLDSW